MQDKADKEITLFDVFEDIAKGWYIFLLAIIVSIAFSYIFYTNQKDTYTIELSIAKIDDVQRSSLPDDLEKLDLFKYFHTNLKTKDKIDEIINSLSLYEQVGETDTNYFDKVLVYYSGNSSYIQFSTPDLKNLDTELYFKDTKSLILSLLNHQEEKSFQKLEKRYLDLLISLENKMLDQENILIKDKEAEKINHQREISEKLEKMNIAYFDLVDKLKSNLEIAKILEIKKPLKLEFQNEPSYQLELQLLNDPWYQSDSLNERTNEIKKSLLTLVVLNDQPLYNYGSEILEREIVLLNQKKLSLQDNFSIKFREIENDYNQKTLFKDTKLYIELLNEISRIKRYIKRLELLRETGFRFAIYDQNEFKFKSDRTSLAYVAVFSTIIAISLAFLVNLIIQYRKK